MVECYVDDMISKSKRSVDYVADLSGVFVKLRKFGLKLNPAKCAFGVRSGKFLGFMVSQRGIEVNPEKIAALESMPSPKNIIEVQRLTRRLVSLARFVSKLAEKGLSFSKVLRKVQNPKWNASCEQAF